MKYVIVRCEDAARLGDRTAALLDGAKTAHLRQLAQAGAAGAIRHGGAAPMDRPRLHQALVGLEAPAAEAAAGQWYAAAVDLRCAEGETAWCCELISQHDGRIHDPTAGNIPTKESELLIQALNEQLGSDARRWEVGRGAHHLLVTRDPAFAVTNGPAVRSPELLVGRAWRRQLPKGALGAALRSLIEGTAKVLEAHPVNRVRIDLGENPANMVWLWGAAPDTTLRTFTEQTGLSGVVVSSSFVLRGFSRAVGLGWQEGPPSFEEPSLQSLMQTLAGLIDRHDLVYLHLRIESADPVERLCAMERIDRAVLKPLTELLPRRGPWRLLAAIDDRRRHLIPFVAIGTGLPQQPVAQLTAQRFAESPLQYEQGAGLFAWFTAQKGA